MKDKPIEFNNVTKKYGNKKILDNVTFALDWQSCTWLAGSNGSGKSTVIKHILGLVKPTTGSVLVTGLDPYYCSSARRYIGFILDKDGVDPLLSTLDNLVFYTKLYIGRKLHGEDYNLVLKRVGLFEYKNALVKTLSAGMKKRLEIAKLLICKPRIIICDEPFSFLDKQGAEILVDVLKEYVAAGACAFVSTHEINCPNDVFDQKIEILHGCLVSRKMNKRCLR